MSQELDKSSSSLAGPLRRPVLGEVFSSLVPLPDAMECKRAKKRNAFI